MLHVNHTSIDRASLCERLFELWEQTGSPALEALAAGRPPFEGASVDTDQQFVDWVSTCLMDSYKDTGDAGVFALLFELNRATFLYAIQCNLRRSYHQVDPQDVLQEVFLNIYRYPHRFQADRADAFRGWGHRIARNTLLKFLKGQTRLACFQTIDDEAVQPEDLRSRRPDRAASDAESACTVNHAYMLYLQLYMLHFVKLSAKERHALTMVEVDGRSYREAAAELGIRLENLKMVIFRGRRKIFRGMERSLAELRAHSDTSEQMGASEPSPRSPGLPSRGAAGAARPAARSASSRRILNRTRLPQGRLCDRHTSGI
ncbi:MAG: RNA polymerase sigma factor [Planctomycetes bacterium]|nr:RNA polymerase sigma factor [Planctomycetota bacterium]